MRLNSGAGLPIKKALGINWNIENDQLSFKVKLNEKPMTRRGILSPISKIYDPLGLAGPFLLKGKKILQYFCRKDYNWDEAVPDDSVTEWENSKKDLKLLENMKMNRSFKPEGFGGIVECSLHHFSDASRNGYGQASNLRLVDEKGTVHCSLVMGKSRVTPTKLVSIPRLELAAAALSVKISFTLRKELTIHPIIKEYFWTDSKVVLAYLNNDVKRFKVYLASRVQLIRDHSDSMQWNYIESKKNPADDTSRDLLPSNAAKVKR